MRLAGILPAHVHPETLVMHVISTAQREGVEPVGALTVQPIEPVRIDGEFITVEGVRQQPGIRWELDLVPGETA